MMTTNIDIQYQNLVRKIFEYGEERSDRTGTGTIGLFGESLDFDLSDGLPMLNTKQVGWKWALIETLWMFVQGSSDTTYLEDHGVSIWKEWTMKDQVTGVPTIGNLYGPVLRGHAPGTVDQVQYVLDLLKNDPFSRRICMTAWDPRFIPETGKTFQENVDAGRGVLSNCHSAFIQFYVSKKRPEDVVKELIQLGHPLGSFQDLPVDQAIKDFNLHPYKLDAQTYQRSCDIGLGLSFNLLQISYVIHMMAQVSGFSPGRVKYLLGDAHVYKNHLEGLSTQLERKPLDHYPQLLLDKAVMDYNEFKLEHFGITKYVHQGKIDLPVSV